MIASAVTDALITIDSVVILALVYLALGLSKLRERIALLEGRLDASQERLHRRGK